MTAAKVMDVVARLPHCDRQAADALSAYIKVKLEDAPRLLRIPRSECPDMWIHLPQHKWPKSCSNIEDPAVSFERNLYGHPFAGWSLDGTIVPHWECPFVHWKGLFLSVYVDDIKIGWREADYGSHVEEVDENMLILMNPHHFLIPCIWGCTHRECKPNEVIIEERQRCSNREFLLEQLKNYQGGKNFTQKTVAWSL